MTDDREKRMLDEALAKLGDYFDGIQIFALRDDGTVFYHGEGNIYSRYGLIKEWVLGVEADMAKSQQQENQDGPEEDE